MADLEKGPSPSLFWVKKEKKHKNTKMQQGKQNKHSPLAKRSGSATSKLTIVNHYYKSFLLSHKPL